MLPRLEKGNRMGSSATDPMEALGTLLREMSEGIQSLYSSNSRRKAVVEGGGDPFSAFLEEIRGTIKAWDTSYAFLGSSLSKPPALTLPVPALPLPPAADARNGKSSDSLKKPKPTPALPMVKQEAVKKPNEVVQSPDWLPKGWFTEVKTRMGGITAGLKYKYFCDPVSKRRFRSKKEVFCFLETGKLGRYKPRLKAKPPEGNGNSNSNNNTQPKPTEEGGSLTKAFTADGAHARPYQSAQPAPPYFLVQESLSSHSIPVFVSYPDKEAQPQSLSYKP